METGHPEDRSDVRSRDRVGFSVWVQTGDRAVVVEVTGEVDIDTDRVWRHYLELACEHMPDHGAVVVDMTGLGFVNAAEIRALHDANRRCSQRGGSLIVVRVPRPLARILNRVDTVRRILILPTVADAFVELSRESAPSDQPGQPPPETSSTDGDDDGVASAPGDYERAHALLTRMAEPGLTDPERKALREQIVLICLPLTESVARRYRGRGEPYGDLLQVARLGLLSAVDRFDPVRGDFLPFAVPTILGEVRRYFRDHSGAIRVPRPQQDINRRLRASTDLLSQRLGRAPTVRELARDLDIGLDEAGLALNADSAYRPQSLDTPSSGADEDGGSHAREQQLGWEDPGYEHIEQYLTVRPLIEQLPERERAILVLRFFEYKTQSEVADILGISQMHVSRLLTKTLARLRCRALGVEAVD